ncbi:MAG: class I SAM-dependent methyltransferase [Syntrophales bacterium]|nr:class I SAM-dependent methyltransferase [Syntrophales bacterium]
MKERFYGFYATSLYLPLSALSRRWRRFTNRIRGKEDPFLQETSLPAVSWRECTRFRAVRLMEEENRNGNVRISELGIIAALAAECPDDTNIFEIGTFDGRTTLNMALQSPPSCRVYTLDLPPDQETRYDLDEGDRHMVNKPESGSRYRKYMASRPGVAGKISQLYGDSAVFDYTPWENSCSLVFVDGSHAYDYARSDTWAAMKLVRKGGVVVWHDYGIWEGVTRALEELDAREGWGLRAIAGTSLVYWKKSSS